MFSRARVDLALLLLLGACTPPASSGPPGPSPASAPPTPSERSASSLEGLTPSFQYHSGIHRYAVINDALIAELGVADSRHHLRSRVIHTIEVSGGDIVSGIIDSIFIERSVGLHPGPDPQTPISWTRTTGPSAAECTMASEIIAHAHTLLPRLRASQYWTDTLTTPFCRPGIRASHRIIATYRLVGPSIFRGDSVLQITRTTETELIPSATHTSGPRGSGRSSAQIYLDVSSGSLAGQLEESEIQIDIPTSLGTRRFVQQTRSQITPIK